MYLLFFTENIIYFVLDTCYIDNYFSIFCSKSGQSVDYPPYKCNRRSLKHLFLTRANWTVKYGKIKTTDAENKYLSNCTIIFWHLLKHFHRLKIPHSKFPKHQISIYFQLYCNMQLPVYQLLHMK